MTNETDDEYDRFRMHISALLKQLPLRSFITLKKNSKFNNTRKTENY